MTCLCLHTCGGGVLVQLQSHAVYRLKCNNLICNMKSLHIFQKLMRLGYVCNLSFSLTRDNYRAHLTVLAHTPLPKKKSYSDHQIIILSISLYILQQKEITVRSTLNTLSQKLFKSLQELPTLPKESKQNKKYKQKQKNMTQEFVLATGYW